MKSTRWTRSISEGFLKCLLRERKPPLAPLIVNRGLATSKHAASWVHRQRPFLVGNPTERVAESTVEDPDWKQNDAVGAPVHGSWP